MTLPTRVGHTFTQALAGTTRTLTPDGSIVTGHWMVLTIMAATAGLSFTPPTGWTQLYYDGAVGTRSLGVYGKLRQAGDTSYVITQSGVAASTATLSWGAGADVVANWQLGTPTKRGGSGAFTNTAASITTAVDNVMALVVSLEATSAAEAAISSISGATEWFYVAQITSQIETAELAYIDKATAGATGAAVVTYPNTQASNGWAVQIGITPAAPPSVGLPITIWNGTAEVPALLTVWNGTTEVTATSDALAFGSITVPEFFAQASVTVAHRGGSACWPEMTLRAYKEAALIWGMKAIEISVQYSADGTPWCHHDATTTRMTGVTGTISAMTDAALAALTNTAANTDNTGQPREPMVRLVDVLALYAASHVIFIEDKTYTHQAALVAMLSTYPNPTDHFVWKQFGDGNPHASAIAAGLTTWGYYFDAQMGATFTAKQALYDYVGLDFQSSDGTLAAAVAAAGAGRTLGHIIASTTQRDRMLGFGMKGLMLANVRACLPKF